MSEKTQSIETPTEGAAEVLNALITAGRGVKDLFDGDAGPLGPGHILIRRCEP